MARWLRCSRPLHLRLANRHRSHVRTIRSSHCQRPTLLDSPLVPHDGKTSLFVVGRRHYPSTRQNGPLGSIWQDPLDALGPSHPSGRDINRSRRSHVRRWAQHPFPRSRCLQRLHRPFDHRHPRRSLWHPLRHQEESRRLERGRRAMATRQRSRR